MKNPKFTHAIQQIRNVTMTASEKKAMLARIVASTTAPAYSQTVRSPWSHFSFGWVTQQPWVVAVAVCLIIVGAGGVSLSAERALPGNALYPIKVSVNESVRDRLAQTPESQALWSAAKSERRINEAAALAVTDSLDQATQEQLQVRLDTYTQELAQVLDEVRQSDSPERADEIKLVFQATLGAQAEILEIISQDDERIGPVADTRIIVAGLARTSADSLDGMNSSARGMTFAKTAAPMMMVMNTAPVAPEADTSLAQSAPAQSSVTEESYIRTHKATQKLMFAVLEQLESASVTQGSLQEKLLTRAAEYLDQAKNHFEEAGKIHDAGDVAGAYSLMLEAQRATIESHIILRAALKKIQ
jgi:hypothetical protein